MKRDFEGAGRAPAPSLITRAELEARLKARAKPVPHPALRPNGPGRLEVDRAIHLENERRIKELNARLETLRSGLRQGHEKALVKDKARAAFAHAR